jgi:hypothetical protein
MSPTKILLQAGRSLQKQAVGDAGAMVNAVSPMHQMLDPAVAKIQALGGRIGSALGHNSAGAAGAAEPGFLDKLKDKLGINDLLAPQPHSPDVAGAIGGGANDVINKINADGYGGSMPFRVMGMPGGMRGGELAAAGLGAGGALGGAYLYNKLRKKNTTNKYAALSSTLGDALIGAGMGGAAGLTFPWSQTTPRR